MPDDIERELTYRLGALKWQRGARWRHGLYDLILRTAAAHRYPWADPYVPTTIIRSDAAMHRLLARIFGEIR